MIQTSATEVVGIGPWSARFATATGNEAVDGGWRRDPPRAPMREIASAKPIGNDPRLAPRLAARRLRRLHAGAARRAARSARGARRRRSPGSSTISQDRRLHQIPGRAGGLTTRGRRRRRTSSSASTSTTVQRRGRGRGARRRSPPARSRSPTRGRVLDVPEQGQGRRPRHVQARRDGAEFDAVCFDVDVPLNGLEGPVKTQFGYHLIRCASARR